MLKAVIFDFDGTVCDTLPLCIAAFRKSIEPLAGRRFSDQEITATFGPSEEGTIRALIPEFYEQDAGAVISRWRITGLQNCSMSWRRGLLPDRINPRESAVSSNSFG